MTATLVLAVGAIAFVIFLRGALEYRLLRQQYRFIEELLVMWAHEAAPETRTKLLTIVRRYRPELVRPDPPKDPPLTTGMDFGVGQMFLRLMGRSE